MIGPYTTTLPNEIGDGTTRDDHFGHLGYLPKFYGVSKDIRFTINSSNDSPSSTRISTFEGYTSGHGSRCSQIKPSKQKNNRSWDPGDRDGRGEVAHQFGCSLALLAELQMPSYRGRVAFSNSYVLVKECHEVIQVYQCDEHRPAHSTEECLFRMGQNKGTWAVCG